MVNKLKPDIKNYIWGTESWEFSSSDVLIKILDAKEDLSVQVHPSKTEAWYVLKDGIIYLGFCKQTDAGEVLNRIENGTITEIMNRINVKRGEFYYIPSGLIHALCGGTKVYEIQQNNNITFRLFDYGRGRELHVERGLEALFLGNTDVKSCEIKNGGFSCRYFSLKFLEGKGKTKTEEYSAITFIKGEGKIGRRAFKEGDSFLVMGNHIISGDFEALVEGEGADL